MKVRIWLEAEFKDEELLKDFGAKLPEVCASYAIEQGLCRNLEGHVGAMRNVAQVKAAFIPEFLK